VEKAEEYFLDQAGEALRHSRTDLEEAG